MDIIGCFLWVALPGAISVVYYDYFYKEAHHKCPHCGSRKTVKLDDNDGEYTNMDFYCKNCDKNFTIERSCTGCWPD
jgi:hypothetical protein